MKKIRSIAKENNTEILYKLLYINKVTGETNMSNRYVSEARAKLISEIDEHKNTRIIGIPNVSVASGDGDNNFIVFKN